MKKILMLAALAAVIAGCPKKTAQPKVSRVGGTLEARSGSTVAGVAVFEETGDGRVKLILNVSGATPGDHGVHVHEKGDCSAPDAASAGAHFNPHNASHGAPGAGHAGDFGNINVKADGTGQMSASSAAVTLAGKDNGILGRALVVHEKADDLASQPAGNAGARIACVVIKEM